MRKTLPCVLVWVLESIFNLESSTSIDFFKKGKIKKKRQKERMKDLLSFAKRPRKEKPISLPISGKRDGLSPLAGTVSAEVIRASLHTWPH